ncbi:hypothetical protein THMIRHAM_05320 [Thiomicrorhabdus immobilis]|uniref:Glycosyltransferase n=1 Tax=Thiomicrorhabdus immobilis TaxID=2791037 RepID=A0ABN6CXV0_9GAMM|nr:glycosyltransferase [Thiomicrorhabdus immobilis]BCN92747.1 hypothetical protein THMIRHAM_05320 [Thiomicrorhabdus immobilis]
MKKKREVIGVIDSYDGSLLRGWAHEVDSNEPVLLQLLINNEVVAEFKADKYRDDLLLHGINKGKASFSIPLDIRRLLLKLEDEGKDEIKLDVKPKDDSCKSRITNSLNSIKAPDIHYNIDSCEYEGINGWIADFNNYSLTILLDIWINDQKIKSIPANHSREDLITRGLTNTDKGFNINIGQLAEGAEFVDVKITCGYLDETILLPSTSLSSFQSKIEAFTDLQVLLRGSQDLANNPKYDFLLKSLIPAVIDRYRKDRKVEQKSIKCLDSSDEKKPVTIVIPVYKGIAETKNCIYSVVNSKNRSDYRLIVISDFSPEEKMLPELLNLQKKYDFDLLANDRNLGFVATVNKGMKYAGNADVILLNSDTVVPDGWLDAIQQAAYSSPTIGTVTPMSNNATICSFPGFCIDNDLPTGYSVESLAYLCKKNQEAEIDLPTAHGYCMFIKRQVLNEVGLFDEQKWGKGYAEENDFSLRANKIGWRHVMTNKTFIHHLGSVSFASDAEGFIAKNLQKLNGLYPDYPKLVEKFIRKDPARRLRNELAVKILKDESMAFDPKTSAKGKSILFVSLSIGGGTKKATDDLIKLLKKEGQNVYYLTPQKQGSIWRLSSTNSNVYADYDSDIEVNDLVKILQELDVWHIHYHNVLGFKDGIWSLPNLLKCEYDITVHDYYAVCPRVNFVSFNDEYCGEKGYVQCQNCLADLGVHDSSVISFTDYDEDINLWRQHFYKKYKLARKVFTPSQDTKQRLQSYFDLENVFHNYHPEPVDRVVLSKFSKSSNENINLGFLGALGPHKGVNVIKQLASKISEQRLPINLKIIGYTSDDDFFKKFDFITLTGKYDSSQLQELIKREQIDAVFLTSIWPETYSYTLSEAISNGKYVVSFDIGAIKERLDFMNVKSRLLFSVDEKPETMLKMIIEFFGKNDVEVIKNGVEYDSILNDYFALSRGLKA